MKTDENNSSQGGTPLSPQGSITNEAKRVYLPEPAKEAAAQIIRSKIDNLFTAQNNINSNANQISENLSAELANINPYEKTHSESTTANTNDWKKYHSAWQEYYQKYYEGYYTHHIEKTKKDLTEQKATQTITVSNEEAIFDLRQKLRNKVKESATNVRKSRHFVPIISGVAVVLIFMFLQFNRIFISNVLAYISPGSINPQNIIIDPNSNIVVGPEPKLIIPKINVEVPVIYDIGNDYNSQMAAMTKGVAHFAVPGANSHPGQIGNTVIAGHSSNDLLDNGDYKFIFVQLEKLNIGDTIYANYNSIRYTYIVTKKEVVKPTDVSKLIYPATNPVITLITCVPIGTADSRLLVTAEQISPDPNQSTKPPTTEPTPDTSSIPGNSPTFLERLFGSSNN